MNKINKSWFLAIILILTCLTLTVFLIKKEMTRPQNSNKIATAEEIKTKQDRKDFFILLDVRKENEFYLEHISGAINIPYNQINKKSNDLPKNAEIIIYCDGFGCSVSETVKNELDERGFKNTRVYREGVAEWKAKGYPTAKGSDENIAKLSTRYSTVPLILAAGLVDGFNPCAIGMLLFLLGYLIIFAEQPKKSLSIGIAYIATTYIAYFLLGLVLLNSLYIATSSKSFNFISNSVNYLIVGILIIAAIINIKDFFAFGKVFSLEIPKKVRGHLQKIVETATLPSTILLAFLVTFFESPCSLPVYVGTLKILKDTYSSLESLIYLGLYNLMFILPLIVLLIIILRGEKMVIIKEWEHKNKSLMKLIMGIMQLIIAVWLLIF